jgi:uncharacterized repeat protein (TIGR01451 family)
MTLPGKDSNWRPGLVAAALLFSVAAPTRAQTIDLQATSITVTPANPTADDTVTITGVITNIGPTLSPAFSWVLTVDANVVDSGRPAFLGPGGQITAASISWTGTLPAGARRIDLIADTALEVTEASEANNGLIRTVTVGSEATHSLTVTRSGSGTVASSPVGITCGATCTASYAAGTTVTLTATPASGSTFAGWGGACAGTAPTCTLAMTQARTASAAFTPETLADLQATSITVTPANPTSGDTVTITGVITNIGATLSPAFSWVLTVDANVVDSGRPAFLGPGGQITAASISWTGTLPAGARRIDLIADTASEVTEGSEANNGLIRTVTVSPEATYSLTVTRSGSGTVASSPAGITCGATCTASYAAGTSVTLTATPASGSMFAGWGGACAGTAPTCTLALTQARTASAAFTPETFADLQATSITVTPAEPATSDMVTITGVITNIGAGLSPAFTWVLSIDSTVVDTGRPGFLGPSGQVTAASISWTGTLPAGAHVIELVADTQSEVAEPSESDNRRTVNQTVRAAVEPSAYWRFDGDARDVSGNGWHGVLSGPQPIANCLGVVGNALAFDGTNDHISFGQLHPAAAGFSVSFWMKPGTALTTTGYLGENEIIGDAGGNRGFRVFQQSNLLIFQTQGLSGNGSSASTTLTAADTTRWSHVTVVYRNRRAELWRDGQLVSEGADSGRLMDAGVRDLQIGRDVNLGSSYWRGALDEVRVHNRALDASEIEAQASTCNRGGPDVTITLTASRTSLTQGETLRYVLNARNEGTQPALGVWVAGPIPDRLSPTFSADPRCQGTVFLRCAIGELAAGAATSVQFDMTILTAGAVTLAVAAGTTNVDINLANNNATATVRALPVRIDGPEPTLLLCEPRPGCDIRADRPTIVLTHGWSAVEHLPQAAAGGANFDWTGTDPMQAARLIYDDLGETVNLLRFVWLNAFTLPSVSPLQNLLEKRDAYNKTTPYLMYAGTQLGAQLRQRLPLGYAQDIQFIGHSFGSIVSTYAAETFLSSRPAVRRARLTALDRPDNVPMVEGFGRDFFITHLHPVVAGPSPALDMQIENYYSTTGFGIGSFGAPAQGSSLVPAYNHPDLRHPSRLDLALFSEGEVNDHGGVQQWYRFTIDPDVANRFYCDGSTWRADNATGERFIFENGSLSPCEHGWDHSLFRTTIRPFPGPLDRSYLRASPATSVSPVAATPNDSSSGPVRVAGASVAPTEFENVQGCALVAAPDSVISCTETIDSLAMATVDVPIDSAYLSFDYRFDTSADGEHATVFLDGTPVWLLTGQLGASSSFATATDIPIRGLAGRRTLTVAFYGAGAMTGRFEIRNLSTTAGTPVSRYLAEGATGTFFDTRIALLNPHASATRVTLRYLSADGASHSQQMTVPGRTRVTIDPKTADAAMQDTVFSTVVDSGLPVVVDRQMTWNGGFGSHAETAIDAPSTTWYLAEGSTSGDFALFYLLQNPGDSPVTATVRYLRPFGQPPIERTYALPPRSRTTIPVDDQGPDLAHTDVSAAITATAPIIVERAMYKSTATQVFAAGHGAAGVTAPATEWSLAEGATGPFFDLFVLLANPTDRAAEVRVDYLLSTGQTFSKTYSVPANGRYTIWVDNEDIPGQPASKPLANVAVSSTITSTNAVPIIVERTMWWPGPEMGPEFWIEAHNSPGTTTTGIRWALAEGEVGGAQGAETYFLVANTSSQPGQARVTLFFEDGTASERVFDLLPRSRTNVNVSSDFPSAAHRRFGALIESLGDAPAQIVVERAMYTSPDGQTWTAGTNALGTRLP